MSPSAVSLLSAARTVTFVTTVAFSLTVIALSTYIMAVYGPDKFSVLALATGVMTDLTVIPMFLLDMGRQGSFFSYIVLEISWLSFLWALWLASGSYAAWTDGQIIDVFPEESSCNFGFLGDPSAVQGCHEIKVIVAFSFIAGILLMGYTVTLLVLAIRAQKRGNSAWTTGVRDGVLFYSRGKGGLIQPAPAGIPLSPPQPQQYIYIYAIPQYPQAPTSVSYANPQDTTPQPPSSVMYTAPQV